MYVDKLEWINALGLSVRPFYILLLLLACSSCQRVEHPDYCMVIADYQGNAMSTEHVKMLADAIDNELRNRDFDYTGDRENSLLWTWRETTSVREIGVMPSLHGHGTVAYIISAEDASVNEEALKSALRSTFIQDNYSLVRCPENSDNFFVGVTR